MLGSTAWKELGYRASPLKVAGLSFPIYVRAMSPTPVSPLALVSWAWPCCYPTAGGGSGPLTASWFPPTPSWPQGRVEDWVPSQPVTSLCLTYKVAEQTQRTKNTKQLLTPSHGLAVLVILGPRKALKLVRYP